MKTIDINGNKLSNNLMMLIYYKNLTGHDLMSDITKFIKFKNFNINNIRDNKGIEGEFNRDFDISIFLINLYIAGRSAYEKRLLTMEDAASEISVTDLIENGDIYSLILDEKKVQKSKTKKFVDGKKK